MLAHAALRAQRGEVKEAIALYEEFLRKFPDFAPAQGRIAALYLEDPASLSKALDLAVKARRNLPDDLEVARTLALVRYQRKEFPAAIKLWEECAQKEPLDAKSLYFLGKSHLQSKQELKGRDFIEKALEAGLPEAMAKEARVTLAELKRK